MRESLLATRSRWLRAYLDGDVGSLADIKDERFAVTSDAGTQTRAQQIAGIAAAVRAGDWFPAGSGSEDLDCEVLLQGDVALVRGHGRTLVPGRVLPVIAFSETWHRAGEAWCVLHLHYSEVRRRR